MGQLPEAERRLRNALAIRRARLAPGSPHTADVALALGELLLHTKRYAEAESMFTAALRAYRNILVPSDPRILKTLNLLGSLCETGQRVSACGTVDSLIG